MKKFKPVAVPKAAFAFCRYTLAIIFWLSLIFRLKSLLIIALIIFLLSAILKIKKAPLILLYSYTFSKLFKSPEEVLNEHAMRFAHIIGSIFSIICLFILYLVNEQAGWLAVFLFALLKSISALGFCPVSKLYNCATNGSCCAFIKKHG